MTYSKHFSRLRIVAATLMAVVLVSFVFTGVVSADPKADGSQEEPTKETPTSEERPDDNGETNSRHENKEPQDEKSEDTKNNHNPQGDEQSQDIQFDAICILGVGFCGSNDPKPQTDTGYKNCGGFLLSQVGLTYRANGTSYTAIHAVPTRFGRLLSGSSYLTMYNDIRGCLNKYRLLESVKVRSWTSIRQQLSCHLLGQYFGGGGSTWDLEGYRDANYIWLANVGDHMCNW